MLSEIVEFWQDLPNHQFFFQFFQILIPYLFEPKLASAVKLVSQRESLYKPCEQEVQKWEENFKKIESLDAKVREVQQRSEHLEKEWEKGVHYSQSTNHP